MLGVRRSKGSSKDGMSATHVRTGKCDEVRSGSLEDPDSLALHWSIGGRLWSLL